MGKSYIEKSRVKRMRVNARIVRATTIGSLAEHCTTSTSANTN